VNLPSIVSTNGFFPKNNLWVEQKEKCKKEICSAAVGDRTLVNTMATEVAYSIDPLCCG